MPWQSCSIDLEIEKFLSFTPLWQTANLDIRLDFNRIYFKVKKRFYIKEISYCLGVNLQTSINYNNSTNKIKIVKNSL